MSRNTETRELFTLSHSLAAPLLEKTQHPWEALPGIGDFIAVALGFLRANVWIVAISMLAGKAIRYWVWMEFVYKIQELF